LGDDNYGIDAGKTANLIVLNTDDCDDTIRMCDLVQDLISRGKLLAETEPAKIGFYSI
jgi:cytosine/creatinine deaminase